MSDGQGRVQRGRSASRPLQGDVHPTGVFSFVRDRIELPANFNATVNAELAVGSLEETITVTGGSPLVDVTSTQKSAIIPRNVLDAVPTGRTYAAEGALVPGVKVSESNVGGARSGSQQRLTVHGSVSADATIEVDGFNMNSWGDVQPNHNEGFFQEVTVQTAALGSEVATGGVRVNLVPKDGGNTFSGTEFVAFANHGMQSSNLTPQLSALGVTSGDAVKRALGLEHLARWPVEARQTVVLRGVSRRRATETLWPTPSCPTAARGFSTRRSSTSRSNDLSAVAQEQAVGLQRSRVQNAQSRAGALTEPSKAAGGRKPVLYYTGDVKFTSTVTSRLMFETGWGASVQSRNTGTYQPGVRKVRGTPEWFANASHLDLVTGWRTIASAGETNTIEQLFTWIASTSYVTGSHNIKVGTQWRYGVNSNVTESNADLIQQYRNGVPDSVVVRNSPLYAREGLLNLDADLGVYAQDSWKINRLTLNPGIRFYGLRESVDPGNAPAGRFVPGRSFSGIPSLLSWNNVSPRVGAAYDLTGDSKTALKFSYSRYYASVTNQYSSYRPLSAQTDQRNWADCAYLPGTSTCNPALIGAAGYHDDIAQDNEIGPSSNSNFGLIPVKRKDPNLARPYNIDTTSPSIGRSCRTSPSPAPGSDAAPTTRPRLTICWLTPPTTPRSRPTIR